MYVLECYLLAFSLILPATASPTSIYCRIRSNACVLTDYPELLTSFNCAPRSSRGSSGGGDSSAQVELILRLSFDLPHGMGWILKADDMTMREVPIGAYSKSQTDIVESIMVPDNEAYTFVLLFDVASAAQRNGAYSVTQVNSRNNDERKVFLLKRSGGPFQQASQHTFQVGSSPRLAIQLPLLRAMRQNKNLRFARGTTITSRSIPGESNLYEFLDRIAYEKCDFARAKKIRETYPGQTVVMAREDGTRFFGADAQSCLSGQGKMIVSIGKVLRLYKRSKCKHTNGYIKRRNGLTVRQCRSACMRNRECLGYSHADSKRRSRRKCRRS